MGETMASRHRTRVAIVLALALSIPLSMLGSSPALAAAAVEESLLSAASEPGVFSPNGDGSGDTSSAAFRLTRGATVTAVVLGPDGSRVRGLAADQAFPAGTYTLEWDGRDDGGRVVADGSYTVSASAVDASGATGTATLATTVDTRTPAPEVIPYGETGEGVVIAAERRGTVVNPRYLYWDCKIDSTRTGDSRVTWGFQLRNAAGDTVRSWEVGSSDHYWDVLSGGCGGFSYNASWFDYGARLPFNGRSADGAMLPDGDYVMVASVTDAGGRTGTAQTPVVIDTRAPAVVAAPVPGSEVSGPTDLVLVPTPGMNVTEVSWYVAGCNGWWGQDQASEDGSVSGLAGLPVQLHT